MKVEVTTVRKPGVKVDVTLVKSRQKAAYCVHVPVRVSSGDVQPVDTEIEAAEIVVDDVCANDTVEIVEAAEQPESEADVEDEVSEDAVVPDEPAPNEEDLLALIEEEEAEMAAHIQPQDNTEVTDDSVDDTQDDHTPEHSAPVSQYMRYFDRDTSGEKVEVNDNRAAGQEIICVDGESGRLSRVCGFIRNNASHETNSIDMSEAE